MPSLSLQPSLSLSKASRAYSENESTQIGRGRANHAKDVSTNTTNKRIFLKIVPPPRLKIT